MRWAVGAVIVALVAAVSVNVLLLGYGAGRNDPVGRLSPIAHVRTPPVAQQPARAPAVDD